LLKPARDGGEWLASRSQPLCPVLVIHRAEGYVGPRTGLNAMGKRKILNLRESNPDLPALVRRYTGRTIPASFISGQDCIALNDLMTVINGQHLASFVGGPEFRRRHGGRLPTLKLFVVFLSPSSRILGQSLTSGHSRFRQHFSN
jgi:hypothetical protein